MSFYKLKYIIFNNEEIVLIKKPLFKAEDKLSIKIKDISSFDHFRSRHSNGFYLRLRSDKTITINYNLKTDKYASFFHFLEENIHYKSENEYSLLKANDLGVSNFELVEEKDSLFSKGLIGFIFSTVISFSLLDNYHAQIDYTNIILCAGLIALLLGVLICYKLDSFLKETKKSFVFLSILFSLSSFPICYTFMVSINQKDYQTLEESVSYQKRKNNKGGSVRIKFKESYFTFSLPDEGYHQLRDKGSSIVGYREGRLGARYLVFLKGIDKNIQF